MNKENLYHKGAELYEREKFADAIIVLLEAYAKDQEDVDTIILLAGCYINIAHFTEAAKWLFVANEIDANNPLIKYNLGYALLCMGRLSDAMKCMNECLGLNPPFEIKKMTKRMLKSEEYFTKKLENNYNISLEEEFECEEKFCKAQEYLYTKRFEEAIALYKFILEKKPNFHRAIQNIGVCYIEQGKPKEALNYFENALSISPTDDLCLGNIAHANYLLGNLEKSREYSEKAMNAVKDPLLRDLIRLITLFIKIEQFEFARKLLTSYSDAHDNAQLTFLSGVVYAKQKDYLAAKGEFQIIRKHSKTAREYLEETKQLIEGRIKKFDFEPKMPVDASEDMI
ncbi:tetratricopeptide repeat protein [Candidatus Woesearchaeota archaeon]|nr:tetratricopeptide repeat protein [Candidatus Woesearchaeota archaeon]